MRRIWSVASLVALLGCGAETITHSPAPPAPWIVGTVRTVPDRSGDPAVEVAAHVSNGTTTHLRLGAGASCPLYVKMLPDWSPEATLSLGNPGSCPTSAFTIDLAPGDSVVFTQVIPAAVFAPLPPMLYGFGVGVVFDGGSVTVFAGSVRLPLGRVTSAVPVGEH
jgi:hypothetical protein